MKVTDMTVRIKADTRQFDRAMRRVTLHMFVSRHSDAIIVVWSLALLVLGALVGVLAS